MQKARKRISYFTALIYFTRLAPAEHRTLYACPWCPGISPAASSACLQALGQSTARTAPLAQDLVKAVSYFCSPEPKPRPRWVSTGSPLQTLLPGLLLPAPCERTAVPGLQEHPAHPVGCPSRTIRLLASLVVPDSQCLDTMFVSLWFSMTFSREHGKGEAARDHPAGPAHGWPG